MDRQICPEGQTCLSIPYTNDGFFFLHAVISRVEFSNEKSEGCCIYRHAGIDYIALWDSLLPLWEVFAAYLGTCV